MGIMHLLILLPRPLLCDLILAAILATFLGALTGLLLVLVVLVVHGWAPAGDRPALPLDARQAPVMRSSDRRERRVHGQCAPQACMQSRTANGCPQALQVE